METYKYTEFDFEHPSILFILEDVLKGLIGGPLLYSPYFKTFGLEGSERVMDFGCGGGAGSRSLVKLLGKNGHLTCVDLSHYWIRKAEKRMQKYPYVECRAGDIREMSLPASSYDVVSAFHVIHDIAPAERQDTIYALSRLLKAGGRFLVCEPTRESHGISAGEIRTLFSNAGLREIVYKEVKSQYTAEYRKTV